MDFLNKAKEMAADAADKLSDVAKVVADKAEDLASVAGEKMTCGNISRCMKICGTTMATFTGLFFVFFVQEAEI